MKLENKEFRWLKNILHRSKISRNKNSVTVQSFILAKNTANTVLGTLLPSICLSVIYFADKPAQIPSMYGYHPSEWGNDGLFGQFFETENSLDPWWRCNLENTHAVSAFKLYNRLDCCSKSANSLFFYTIKLRYLKALIWRTEVVCIDFKRLVPISDIKISGLAADKKINSRQAKRTWHR